MTKKLSIFATIIFGFSSYCLRSYSELRAYQLEFYDKDMKLVRKFASTLDEFQYQTYFQIPKGLTMVRTDTWMCYERTDHAEALCPNPNDKKTTQGDQRELAAETDETESDETDQ